ncbi:MAG TPA: hypothetical protein VFE63_06835 [Roseiarcus sp.]|nr:hypothetical protein [Roseiarcus sp.]
MRSLSARFTVGKDGPASSATSACESLAKCRAARICAGEIKCIDDGCIFASDGARHGAGAAGGYHHCEAGAFTHPRSMSMFRLGKRRAVRVLDGVEHNGFPSQNAL